MKPIVLLSFFICISFSLNALNVNRFPAKENHRDLSSYLLSLDKKNASINDISVAGNGILIDQKFNLPESFDQNSFVCKTVVCKTIEINPGELSTILSDDEKSTITNLIVKGSVDARDFKSLRDEFVALSELDLSNVSITEYYGDGGTIDTINLYKKNHIPDLAFFNPNLSTGKESLVKMIFPKTIEGIGAAAFAMCYGLSGSLYFPASLKTIGDDAFFNCNSIIDTIFIPSSTTNIGDGVFAGCKARIIVDADNHEFLVRDGILYNINETRLLQASGIQEGTLNLPETLIEIGSNAFFKCSNLTGSLIIPPSVKLIGPGAFFECSGFNGELFIPVSLDSIHEKTFYSCSGFTGDLKIPSSVTYIGRYAFSSCNNFSKLTLSNGLQYIDDNGFENCSGFKGTLIIPSTVKTVGSNSFCECIGFNSLDLGSSVQRIRGLAFCRCTGISGQLIIPESVDYIGHYAFYGCTGFNNKLHIGNSVKEIGKEAFRYCSGFTGNLKLPDSVIKIGSFAFESCTGFDGSLSIGNALEKIEAGTFQNCSGLNGNLNIPSSVISLGNNTFYGCSNFTRLFIPASVLSIGDGCFCNCNNLNEIHLGASDPVDLSDTDNVFCNINTGNCTLFVPQGSEYLYHLADQWKNFIAIIEYVPTSVKSFIDNQIQISFAQNIMNIRSDCNPYNHSEIQIYDIFGKLIISQWLNDSNTKIPFYYKGIYLVLIKNEYNIYSGKIAVK